MTITNGYCTLPQIKTHLGVSRDDDDVRLEQLVQAASRAIDSYCGRSFFTVASSARVYRACHTSHIDIDDATSISAVKTDTGNNGTYDQTWTVTTDYVLEPFDGIVDGITGWPYSRITCTGPRYFPIYGPRARVQVTGVWGWSAVPDAVREACLIKTAKVFRRKQSPDGIAAGEQFGAIRVSRNEDPEVCMLLGPYRQLAGRLMQ